MSARAPPNNAALHDTSAPAHLAVLQSIDAPGEHTNPYLVQLMRALPGSISIRYFSMRRALFSRYDVLHVHWPEYLLRHRTVVGTALKQACMLLLMLRLRLQRIAVVRTLHNESPHERGGRRERWLLRALDRMTGSWIRLNPATAPRPPASPLILHGHYRDWFPAPRANAQVRGRLLSFGLIRGYKGIDALLDAMAGITAPDVSLRIVGNPTTDALRASLQAVFDGDPRIDGSLRYVSDDELALAVGEAELVVLSYERMTNSGALLLALSLSRPVLAPRTAANEAIAAEVGEGWVLLFDGRLQASTLVDALDQARRPHATANPDLSQREWPEQGARHRAAYRAAWAAAHARAVA